MAHASSGAGTVGALRIMLAAWLAVGVAGGAYVWLFHVQPKLQELAAAEPETPLVADTLPPDPDLPPALPDLPSEPKPAPAIIVEPYQPPEQLVVRGTSVRFREQPYATPETPVVRYAEAGERLNVVGRVVPPDGITWFQVQLPEGLSAFIRSDFTEAIAPDPSPLVAAPAPLVDPSAGFPATSGPVIRFRPRPGSEFRMPDYPPASRRAGEEGDVVVAVCVDRTGAMSNATLVKSSGHPRLDAATLQGLTRTRIEPARDTDGLAVDFCSPPYQLTITWKLQN
jgi:TonB family protein